MKNVSVVQNARNVVTLANMQCVADLTESPAKIRGGSRISVKEVRLRKLPFLNSSPKRVSKAPMIERKGW